MAKHLQSNSDYLQRQHREELLGFSNPKFIHLTGLSGSGKTTIAGLLEKELYQRNLLTKVIDGDELRLGLTSHLGFSDEDRKENIRIVGELARTYINFGTYVISAVISPFEEPRREIRNKLNDQFVEVYVNCPLQVCEERDTKGLYKKARAGEIKNFTGIDSAYEAPKNPEVIINTHEESPQECVDKIISFLRV